MKSENRKPKSETNPKSKTRTGNPSGDVGFEFRVSSFFRILDFGFRIS